jgi:hypothetical protein
MLLPPGVGWSLGAGGPGGGIDANGNFTAQQAGDFKITAAIPGGPSASMTVTVGAEGSLAPVLSNVTAVVVGESSANVAWNTNEPTDAQVEYGFTAAYGSLSMVSPAMSTAHVVVLTGLTPGKMYHYRVHCRNSGGKEAVSGDAVFTMIGAPGRRLGR